MKIENFNSRLFSSKLLKNLEKKYWNVFFPSCKSYWTSLNLFLFLKVYEHLINLHNSMVYKIAWQNPHFVQLKLNGQIEVKPVFYSHYFSIRRSSQLIYWLIYTHSRIAFESRCLTLFMIQKLVLLICFHVNEYLEIKCSFSLNKQTVRRD